MIRENFWGNCVTRRGGDCIQNVVKNKLDLKDDEAMAEYLKASGGLICTKRYIDLVTEEEKSDFMATHGIVFPECVPVDCAKDCAVDCAADCADLVQSVESCVAFGQEQPDFLKIICPSHFISTIEPDGLFTEIQAAQDAGTLGDAWKHFSLVVTLDDTTVQSIYEFPAIETFISGTCEENCIKPGCVQFAKDNSAVAEQLCTIDSLFSHHTPEDLAVAIQAAFVADTLGDAWKNFIMKIAIDSSITKVDISVPLTEGFRMKYTGKRHPAFINIVHIFVIFPFIYYMGFILRETHPTLAKAAMAIGVLGVLYHLSLALQKM